jgi:hypothetical protein
MLTKTEEVELFDRIIAECPPGYVRDILTAERPAVIDAIRNDLAFTDVAALSRELIELRQQTADERKRLTEAKAALRQQQREHQRLTDAIAELRTVARRLAAV